MSSESQRRKVELKKVLEEIMAKNYPNLAKDINLKLKSWVKQSTQRDKNTSWINFWKLKTEGGKTSLSKREEETHTEETNQMTVAFSLETIKA